MQLPSFNCLLRHKVKLRMLNTTKLHSVIKSVLCYCYLFRCRTLWTCENSWSFLLQYNVSHHTWQSDYWNSIFVIFRNSCKLFWTVKVKVKVKLWSTAASFRVTFFIIVDWKQPFDLMSVSESIYCCLFRSIAIPKR